MSAERSNGNDDEGHDRDHGRGQDDDDDDDRKPPAKEIHLVNSAKRRRRRRMNNTFDSSSNLTNETSSISSWTSPCARLPSASSREEESLQETTPSKKQNFRLPSLTAITPFSTGKSSPQSIGSLSKGGRNRQPASLQSFQVILSLWMSTLLLSVVYFAYLVLPVMAFSTAAFMVVSSAGFAQALFLSAQHLYNEAVVNGNGLGSILLPSSINEMLTETTMHEFLSGSESSAMDGYQYLALYFLPLSQQQRDAALARLAPNHRSRLHQPGLGQWIMGANADPWRLLVGNRRYYRNRPLQLGPMDTVIEAVDPDDSSSSSLGLDTTGDDTASGGLQDSAVVRRLSLGSEEEEPHHSDVALVPMGDNPDEMDVIMDAVWTSALSTVVYPFMSSIYQTIWPVTTVSSSLVGMAAGFTWIVQGVRLNNNAHSRRESSSSWAVLLGGGATVVLSLVGARYGFRGVLQQGSSSVDRDDTKKNRKNPKKS